jgi:glycosyltransferase involved in cell wall biosynthesis
VCLSEHEGFCVPVLEAMHHGLPVVAFAAGAVPETVGGAGLVLSDKSPALVAASVDRVLTDPAVRDGLAAARRARLAAFALPASRDRLAAALDPVLCARPR